MPAYNPDTFIETASDGSAHTSSKLPGCRPQTSYKKSSVGKSASVGDDADALHESCGVYTNSKLVGRLLDRVAWTANADLTNARLLEPGAGDGAFLVEATRRLISSFTSQRVRPDIERLRDRILAYELLPAEADKARARVVAEMKTLGVHHATASACANAWVKCEDFLLADLPDNGFTHIVGNPPYVRWSKLPDRLSDAYARELPKAVARGDLYLPFLHRSFEHLTSNGRCAFVCSDRWRYTVYAREFRKKWYASLHIKTETVGPPGELFSRDVYVSPEILLAYRRTVSKSNRKKRRRRDHTLSDLGCTVRVGPALGVTPAFVLGPAENDVETELLHRWIATRDVLPGSIECAGRRVICPFDVDGNLIDLQAYPRLAARLRRFEARLRDRYIVRNGAVWYRTIDKITPVTWAAPKLLIPEFARLPRVAIDLTGGIPSHGIYAVFPNDVDIDELYDRLRDGKLARALDPIAPKVKGGYTRCYGRFLTMMEI